MEEEIWLTNFGLSLSESLSYVWLFTTRGIVAQPGSSVYWLLQLEYWNGLPLSSPGDLPDPGIKPRSPTMQADSLPSEPQGKLTLGFRECLRASDV